MDEFSLCTPGFSSNLTNSSSYSGTILLSEVFGVLEAKCVIILETSGINRDLDIFTRSFKIHYHTEYHCHILN